MQPAQEIVLETAAGFKEPYIFRAIAGKIIKISKTRCLGEESVSEQLIFINNKGDKHARLL